MEFTRQTLKTVRADLDEALATVAQKYGITLSLGAISFRPESFSVRLKAEGGKAGGLSAAVRAKKEFEEYAGMFFLHPSDFGMKFFAAGRYCAIVGISPRRRMYPILGEDTVSGKVFKFAAAEVLAALGRHEDAKKARIGRDYRATERFNNRHED